MVEYRPFPEERETEFYEFTSYAFLPEEGHFDPEEHEDKPTLIRRRGLFDGDDPVVVCGHHDFQLRIRGQDRQVAGLSAVASAPEHRRQGHVRRLLEASLAEYREDDDVAYSVLWPFEHAFYRQYGWATVSQFVHVKAPPDQLAFVTDVDDRRDSPGTFRELDAGDHDEVRPVFAAMAEQYDFTMAQSADWWEHQTLSSWDTDPFVYGWKRAGDLRGVIKYTFENSGEDRILKVHDVAFNDETAWLQLLRFCRNHDSQVSEVRLRAPPDVELLDRVDDPRAITCERRAGPMFRLVDVADALERLAPQVGGDEEGAVDLVVSDPLVDWNDGRFRVQVRDGTVSAEQVESADRGGDEAATVSVDIGTLSQLYAGYHGVEQAERLGDLEFDERGTDAARSTLAALFPPRTTHLREGF